MFNAVLSVRCWVYSSVDCSLFSVECTVYSVKCTVYRSLFSPCLCSMQMCPPQSCQGPLALSTSHKRTLLYTVHCTPYTVQCTLYTLHCSLFTVHCTLCLDHTMNWRTYTNINFTLHYTEFYNMHYKLFSAHCTVRLYTVHHTICSRLYYKSPPACSSIMLAASSIIALPRFTV